MSSNQPVLSPQALLEMLEISEKAVKRLLLDVFFPKGSTLPKAPGLPQLRNSDPRQARMGDLYRFYIGRVMQPADCTYVFSCTKLGLEFDVIVFDIDGGGYELAFQAVYKNEVLVRSGGYSSASNSVDEIQL